MTLVVLDLGTNIDREVSLASALEHLAGHFELKNVSSVYRSVPVGMSNQPDFFNLSLELETDKKVDEIRQIARQIEDDMGRNRSGPKFGPRNIDIDVVLYGESVDAEMGVPHPQAAEELFVVAPLAELRPDGHHPGTGQKWVELRGKLMAGRSEKDAGIEKQFPISNLELGEKTKQAFGAAR